MIGREILHYRIIEQLGEGGMGVVYRAHDSRLGRNVAIKFLPHRIATNDERRERFKIEAQAAAALNHPNIATIHAIEDSDLGMFIVMELIEGTELGEWIAQDNLEVERILDIAFQIAEGLRAAHDKGIIHRDIKPANIMITTDGRVKITDFGLAKIGAGVHLTKSGTAMGTVSYMSPEQVRGGELDHRTDIWSFGVVLYEMLSGRRPFEGSYDQQVLHAVLNSPVEPVSAVGAGLPESVDRLVCKMLEKHRDDRHRCMEDVMAELRSIVTEIGGDPRTGAGATEKGRPRPDLAALPLAGLESDPDTEVLDLAGEKHEAFKSGVVAAAAPTLPNADSLRTPGSRDVSPTSGNVSARSASCPDVRYCMTDDGNSIAYAVHGSGPVLVRVLGWFTHLEMEWSWPALRLIWERLAERHTVVRYDGRGIGLSTPWDGEFTEETRQLDLHAVLNAVGAETVALFGISEGGWTAAHYAFRHPERVSHLIIYGSYSRGASFRAGFDAEEAEALETLMRKGWGRDTPEIRQIFTTAYFGSAADPRLIAHFNDLQRAAADGDTAARYQRSLHRRGDARDVFGGIRTPTLVIHCREDRVVPFEEGRRIASIIPAAKFLPLPTMAHYFPLDDDLTHEMTDAIDRFTLSGKRPSEPGSGQVE